MALLELWGQFGALALVIGFAGHHLSRYADVIAEGTGLGRNWIGVILLATVTSLPELTAGVSAVRVALDPELAVGDILGSCLFNLTLVVILDLLHRESSVYSKATQGHLLSGALGMILISYVGFALLTGRRFPELRLAHMGVSTLLLPLLYGLSMRAVYRFEKGHHKGEGSSRVSSREVQAAFGYFTLAAIVVVGAGAYLPVVGTEIVRKMGWSSAFFGTLFIAFGTSLPEIAVTLSALRLRAVELAFSNLLGSNLFNVVILFVDDFFYTQGPLLASVNPAHGITAFSAVMMTGLVSLALMVAPRHRLLGTVSALSLVLVLIYTINAVVLFKLGGH